MPKQVPGQIDLFEVIEEAENGPPPCPHIPSMKTGGWSLEHDPKSPYFWEWVHAHPDCRRSKFPGRKHKDAPPRETATRIVVEPDQPAGRDPAH